MIALDADILSDLMRGRDDYVQRVGKIPSDERYIPIVVIEETMRGPLNAIRRSESGKSKQRLASAYAYFEETVKDLRNVPILSLSTQAENQVTAWRQQGFRTGTRDLRIAAIAVAHSARLITRNRRHFEQLPGLDVEFWD
jgi:tRNA(fMet)-specific endonuclease VapC